MFLQWQARKATSMSTSVLKDEHYWTNMTQLFHATDII
jgi:hypothetical protein